MKSFVYSILLASAAVFCGCSGAQTVDTSLFSEELYVPSYAAGFEILGAAQAQSSLLRVTRPWQGESLEEFELLVLRGGEKAPADFRGAVIEEAAARIVTLSSSNLAMFDRMGQAERIVGVSGIDYISSPTIQQRAKSGAVRDVGYEGNLNYELLTLLDTDIVLLYSVAGRNPSVTAKLDELAIPYIYIGDYAEESPLGKAEWMVAMGEICGKRTLAEQLFEQSAEEYNTLKSLCEEVDPSARPRVMLNTPYRDVWYMPSSRSYMVRLIEDAGGEYIYMGNNSQQTEAISIEQAYKLATTADVWLNTGTTINSIADLRSQVPKFKDMGVVQRGEVYNNTARRTPRGGSDFWESGVIYPERVLRDLIEILHPALLEGDSLYYYRKL